MRILRSTSKWYQHLWAALIFFTRLPFWRVYQPPKESYRAVVEFWPLTGWLTGGAMAAILYFGSAIFPYAIVVALAIVVRLLITGALHEDGLADFFDAFGGNGNDRQRILEIMKDSRIGTYGVLGLVFYVLLLYLTLSALPPKLAALTILAADPYAKMLSAQMTQMMPYARTEETSKAHTVYRRMSILSGILLAIQGLLPLSIYIWLHYQLSPITSHPSWQWLLFVPCLTMYCLYRFVWHRLRGYTGDCCGAFFLLIELSIYLTVVLS